MQIQCNVSKLISRKFFKTMNFRAFQMPFDNKLIETYFLKTNGMEHIFCHFVKTDAISKYPLEGMLLQQSNVIDSFSWKI